MFFANISRVYSLSGNSKIDISNVEKKSNLSYEFSNSKLPILKIDLFDDFDNDSDDEECNTFVNKNNNPLAIFSTSAKSSIIKFACKKSSKPVYFTTNFSRLPRVSYLSICDFRI